MTGRPRTPRDDQIAAVAEKYSAGGYDVQVEPSPPFDLGGFQPDIVARKDTGGLIIQVKESSARMPVDGLRQIAERVAQHTGWRFLLVTAEDTPSTGLPGVEGTPPTWNEVESRLHVAHRLRDFGDMDAAYFALWVAFERLLRLQAARASIPVERLPPSQMIRHLYSFGELTAKQYDTARRLQDVRNRVAHGARESAAEADFFLLKNLIHELGEQWGRIEPIPTPPSEVA